MLYRITAPHFVAGIETQELMIYAKYDKPLEFYGLDHVRFAAPIVSYMRGKSIEWVQSYCQRKGWKVEEVQ